MGSVTRDIFKAIHEQKCLSVEYRNKQEQVTRYWIGINDLNPLLQCVDISDFRSGTRPRRSDRMSSRA